MKFCYFSFLDFPDCNFLKRYTEFCHTVSSESYTKSFNMTSRVPTNFYSKYTNAKTFNIFFGVELLLFSLK